MMMAEEALSDLKPLHHRTYITGTVCISDVTQK
jgi:hypothetical protein